MHRTDADWRQRLRDQGRVTLDASEAAATDLVLTDDQQAVARLLLAEYRALSDVDRRQLIATLQREVDPRLLSAIARDLALLEQGNVKLTERPGKPVTIADLPTKLGWAADGWQMRLLKAIDGAGHFETNGLITAGEIVTGLRNPSSPNILTTANIQRFLDLIGAGAAGQGTDTLVADLKLAWQREVAARADALGDGDQRITQQEIMTYFAKNPDAIEKLAIQNVGVMLHEIATLTGEPDPFRMLSRGTDIAVTRTAYVGSFDTRTRLATALCQVVTSDDLKQRGKIERANNFFPDQLLPKEFQVPDGLYELTGYDLGHILAAGDATTVENERQSYSTLNIEPETPQLNRGMKRMLESALRDLVVATNARAVFVGGQLFLDEKGNPMALDDSRIQFLEKRGQRLPIPTHVYKCALLQLPGGSYTAISYIMENRRDLKADSRNIQGYLTNTADVPPKSGRASIAQIEKLVGSDFRLFDGFLPTSAKWAQELREDSASSVPLDHSGRYLAASKYLWSSGAPAKSWSYESITDIDVRLELIRQYLAWYKPPVDPRAELKKLVDAIQGAGSYVSRAEALKIVAAANVDALGPEERIVAVRLIRGALGRAKQSDAKEALAGLLETLSARSDVPSSTPTKGKSS